MLEQRRRAMHILCLDQFGDLGGAQRCLLDLLPALANRGWSAHVAAPGDGDLSAQAAALHATVDPIHCGPYSSGHKTPGDMARFAMEAPRLAREIRSLVRRYDADLIYVNGPRLLPATALAARQGPPVLFHAHNLLDGYALRAAGWALERTGAAIVACSRFVAQSLLPFSGDRGIRVVYNGVRQTAGARVPVRDLPGSPPTIGMIGRISPEKGQSTFLRAARILHRELPQCRFLICGAPLFSDPQALRYCSELDELAEDLPVEFTGWKPDVESVLARLDLLVVPSAPQEALARVILEAFAAGVPVMAFASGGIPEVIQHNITGFLVELRSPQVLASAMRDLLCEPHRLRQAVVCARAKARREFTLERYQAQMIEALEAARLTH